MAKRKGYVSQKGLQFKCLYQRRNQFRDKRISVDTYGIHNGGQNPLCFPLVPWAPHHCPTSRLCQSWQKSFKFFHWRDLSLSSTGTKKYSYYQIRDIILHPLCDSWLHAKFFTGLLKSLVLKHVSRRSCDPCLLCKTYICSKYGQRLDLAVVTAVLPASKESNRMQQSCRH